MTREPDAIRIPLPQPRDASASTQFDPEAGIGDAAALSEPDRSEDTFAAHRQAVEWGQAGSNHGGVRAAYVHIPFCFHKCHYCDFYSIVDDREERRDAFFKRMLAELDAWRAMLDAARNPEDTARSELTGAWEFDTIFVGGGTPTLLGPDRLARLLPALRAGLRLGSGAEFTVEANPETVTGEIAQVLASSGVNRVSIGAQSFHLHHLKTLERWHEPESVARAVSSVRAVGIDNVNIDLIFGIPGQTLEEWMRDVELACLEPSHLSCYGLTYEPNTAMTMRLRAGEFEPIDDSLEAEMFVNTRERLRAAGFDAYEISNFSKYVDKTRARSPRDYRCQHNLAYWRNQNWIALGPAAAGHVNGFRWKNAPHLGKYLAPSPDGSGFAPLVEAEHTEARTQLCDRLMMGLRLAEGVDEKVILQVAKQADCLEALRAGLQDQLSRGRLAIESSRIAIPDDHLLIADAIISDLIGAVQSD